MEHLVFGSNKVALSVQHKGGGGGGAWTSHQVWRQNWSKVQPGSLNKRKNVGSFVTTRCKSWEKVPILGLSEIQSAKIGVYLTYMFGCKLLGCNKHFRDKFDAKPPNLLKWISPWDPSEHHRLHECSYCLLLSMFWWKLIISNVRLM